MLGLVGCSASQIKPVRFKTSPHRQAAIMTPILSWHGSMHARGALIHEGNGLDMHTNGVDMVRVICLLIALTGNIGQTWRECALFNCSTKAPSYNKDRKKADGLGRFPSIPELSVSRDPALTP
jgi:anaerobic selenocysteine-containing dehydrogenase